LAGEVCLADCPRRRDRPVTPACPLPIALVRKRAAAYKGLAGRDHRLGPSQDEAGYRCQLGGLCTDSLKACFHLQVHRGEIGISAALAVSGQAALLMRVYAPVRAVAGARDGRCCDFRPRRSGRQTHTYGCTRYASSGPNVLPALRRTVSVLNSAMQLRSIKSARRLSVEVLSGAAGKPQVLVRTVTFRSAPVARSYVGNAAAGVDGNLFLVF
jgi:hypothetical protein